MWYKKATAFGFIGKINKKYTFGLNHPFTTNIQTAFYAKEYEKVTAKSKHASITKQL